MSAAELRDAERLIDLLLPNLERRRTRRSELHHHGRTVAPRVMFRRSLATGGDVLDWVWRRPVRRPRQLIVICDISGSMERHARVLLRFSQALAASAVRTEAFVFGTRLTRVTRLLRDRDRDRALTRVSQTVSRLVGRDPDRRVVPDVQPALGPARPAQQRRGRRRQRRLGSWRPGAGGDRDGPAPAQLPPPDLAESAGQRARLPAACRRDVGGPAVHRRLRARPARSPASSDSACSSPTPRPAGRPSAGRAARRSTRSPMAPRSAGRREPGRSTAAGADRQPAPRGPPDDDASPPADAGGRRTAQPLEPER